VYKHIFQIFIEIDQVLSRSDTSGIEKWSTTYWRTVEPTPKYFTIEGLEKGGSDNADLAPRDRGKGGSAQVGSGGSVTSNLAKGGSETGHIGGGKPGLATCVIGSASGVGTRGVGGGLKVFGAGKGSTNVLNVSSSGVTSIPINGGSGSVAGTSVEGGFSLVAGTSVMGGSGSVGGISKSGFSHKEVHLGNWFQPSDLDTVVDVHVTIQSGDKDAFITPVDDYMGDDWDLLDLIPLNSSQSLESKNWVFIPYQPPFGEVPLDLGGTKNDQ
jgi:hypothetical protein